MNSWSRDTSGLGGRQELSSLGGKVIRAPGRETRVGKGLQAGTSGVVVGGMDRDGGWGGTEPGACQAPELSLEVSGFNRIQALSHLSPLWQGFRLLLASPSACLRLFQEKKEEGFGEAQQFDGECLRLCHLSPRGDPVLPWPSLVTFPLLPWGKEGTGGSRESPHPSMPV